MIQTQYPSMLPHIRDCLIGFYVNDMGTTVVDAERRADEWIIRIQNARYDVTLTWLSLDIAAKVYNWEIWELPIYRRDLTI